MNKKFLAVLTLIIVAVVGVVVYSATKKTPGRSVEKPKEVQVDDHVRGKAGSKVYLVEYADYECPACHEWEPTVEKITKEYGDRVAFIFRNYPLTDIHINAKAAAKAAEAAGLQGKFWEMHDLIYAKYSDWANARKSEQAKFEEMAQSLGLDMTKFKADYLSNAVEDRINSDIESAKTMKVGGTPTFFLNGEKIELGSISSGEQKLRDLLDAKLKELN